MWTNKKFRKSIKMPYLGIPYCETLLLHKHFKCEQQTLNYEIKRKINII